MKIGYARVSTDDQDTGAQVAKLKEAGCTKIYKEKISGGSSDRPVLDKMLASLAAGDELTVYKLDRLSRSLPHTLQILATIEKKGASFRSLTEAIDTTTPPGRALMHMIATFAEFELAWIRERTNAGLAHARRRGKFGGRPRSLNGDKVTAALQLLEKMTLRRAAGVLGCSLSTLNRALKRRREEEIVAAERVAKGKQHGKASTKTTTKSTSSRTPRSTRPGRGRKR